MATDALYGSWINVAYLESLQKTKSTKAAQGASPLSLVTIRREGGKNLLTTVWNFHEGGSTDTVRMSGPDQGEVISGYKGDKTFDLELRPNGRLVLRQDEERYEFAKFSPQEARFGPQAGIVNQTLFAGTYGLGDKTVRLLPDGRVTGIDSLLRYEAVVDYIGEEADFDQLYLSFKGGKAPRDYGYEFRRDTLEIFRLQCLEGRAEEVKGCQVYTRGEPAYVLERLKEEKP